MCFGVVEGKTCFRVPAGFGQFAARESKSPRLYGGPEAPLTSCKAATRFQLRFARAGKPLVPERREDIPHARPGDRTGQGQAAGAKRVCSLKNISSAATRAADEF
jgi:hypothetical protein